MTVLTQVALADIIAANTAEDARLQEIRDLQGKGAKGPDPEAMLKVS